MRHFFSLVLAIVLAPVIWGALAFGLTYSIRGATTGGTFDRNQLIGTGLLLAAGLALGILLSARISPIGPAIAGLFYLAASGFVLWSGNPLDDWADKFLSTSDAATVVQTVRLGLFWMLGIALLVPVFVPSRWRRKLVAPAAAGAGGAVGPMNIPANQYGPPSNAPAQSGAPGWSASPNSAGPNAAGPNAGPNSDPDAAPAGSPVPVGVDAGPPPPTFDQTRPYGNLRAGQEPPAASSYQPPPPGAYQSDVGNEYASAPGWDTPPRAAGQDQAYPAATYPPADRYQGSQYQGSQYEGGQYQGSQQQGGQYQGGQYQSEQAPPDQYRPDQYQADQNRADQNRADQNRADQNRYPSQPAAPDQPAGAYPARTYPTTYSAPSYGGNDEPGSGQPASPPQPASYAPTVYGSRSPEETAPLSRAPEAPGSNNPVSSSPGSARPVSSSPGSNRPVSSSPAPSSGAAAGSEQGATDELDVDRHDQTRRVYRPRPPAWGPSNHDEDPNQTRQV